MSEERKTWERMEEEPLKWFSRFDKFRLMKPWERSVYAVYEEEQTHKKPQKPTTFPGKSWYGIAKQWQWNERAEAWDKYRIAERDRQIVLEEAEIMKEEYALKHKRIKDLNKIANMLREEVFDDDKRWIEDVKAVGLEAHYIKQFNDGLLKEYREYLSDIAAEMGERIKTTKAELSGKVDGDHVNTEKIIFYMPEVDEEDDFKMKGDDANANGSDPESSQG